MATSLKISEKVERSDHLQFNTYRMVQRLWKSVQWILRYFGSELRQHILRWQSHGKNWSRDETTPLSVCERKCSPAQQTIALVPLMGMLILVSDGDRHNLRTT